MKKNMSTTAAVRLTDAFLIVFGQQWGSIAQRNNMYQALATHAIIYFYILYHCWFWYFGLFMVFVDIEKTIEYHQSYSLRFLFFTTRRDS